MPSGLKRFQKAEGLHFITFSCFHRLPLLEAPAAKDLVEAVLEQIRAASGPSLRLRADARACPPAGQRAAGGRPPATAFRD
jgi:hypothetical protein